MFNRNEGEYLLNFRDNNLLAYIHKKINAA